MGKWPDQDGSNGGLQTGELEWTTQSNQCVVFPRCPLSKVIITNYVLKTSGVCQKLVKTILFGWR